jgi:hypothetical protein
MDKACRALDDLDREIGKQVAKHRLGAAQAAALRMRAAAVADALGC